MATAATTDSPVGSYAITVSGASHANYTITFVGGTLAITNITKAPEVYWVYLPRITTP